MTRDEKIGDCLAKISTTLKDFLNDINSESQAKESIHIISVVCVQFLCSIETDFDEIKKFLIECVDRFQYLNEQKKSDEKCL